MSFNNQFGVKCPLPYRERGASPSYHPDKQGMGYRVWPSLTFADTPTSVDGAVYFSRESRCE